jgi:hypothetical protein
VQPLISSNLLDPQSSSTSQQSLACEYTRMLASLVCMRACCAYQRSQATLTANTLQCYRQQLPTQPAHAAPLTRPGRRRVSCIPDVLGQFQMLHPETYVDIRPSPPAVTAKVATDTCLCAYGRSHDLSVVAVNMKAHVQRLEASILLASFGPYHKIVAGERGGHTCWRSAGTACLQVAP